MIAVGLLLVGLLYILTTSDVRDPQPNGDTDQWLDVLLFLLILAGVVHKHIKRAREDDDLD